MANFNKNTKLSEVISDDDSILRFRFSTREHKDVPIEDATWVNMVMQFKNCTIAEILDWTKQTKVIQWQRANRPNLPADNSTIEMLAEHAGIKVPPKTHEEVFDEMSLDEQQAEIEKYTKIMEKNK